MKKKLIISTLLTLTAAYCLAGEKLPKGVRLPKNTTVYGQVLCDGQPKEGVVVSDGDLVVRTGRQGFYFMASEKKEGSVFVSIPSCTEVETKDAMPAFWQKLSEDRNVAERHDFSLTGVDNTSHVVIAISDLHLANINDDVQQFKDVFMPRLNEEVNKYKSKGIPVYCINAGDSSYDRYWYEYLYTIADFPATLKEVNFPVPIFSSMGNHDNNGATPRTGDVDFNAAGAYRDIMGPTRYSFNIGDVHYVVLDDIAYKNSEGRIDSYEGITGKRDYDTYFREDACNWLKKDLETVPDKTAPLVLIFHIPIFEYASGVSSNGIRSRMSHGDADPDQLLRDFTSLLKDFSDVHFITGHTHKSLPCYGRDDKTKFPEIANILDHNISSVGGCWWQTGSRRGLTLAPDSAPAGFEVFPIDGRQMQWYFVSDDDGCARQFRVFDMNSVRDYYRTNGEIRAMLKHMPAIRDYSKIEDNVVLIHVWAWETPWKISVSENGVELPVKAVKAENPQFTINYYLPKSAWEDNGSSRWPVKYNKSFTKPHFFRVKASAPNTTITVKVTDTFGNEYVQVVERPKAFGKTMR